MIKLQSISKSFDGVSVLENISAEIPDSGIFAICGASGSGKTTLMRIILGLEQPDSGNIYGLEGKKRQSSFKTTDCSRGSVRSTMSPPCAQRSAQRAARKVELSDSLDKKPAELSGGMCRRVALARALAFDADILLLDEPFKGLDAELRGRTVKLVEDFAKTKPVILITHDPWEASLAGAKRY